MNIFGATAVAVDAAIPEPGTLALLMLGVIGVACFKRKSA